MKTRLVPAGCLLTLSIAGFFPGLATLAEETNSPAITTAPQPSATLETPAAPSTAAVKLPYGVADVLKLSRAQISEDIIVNYVQNSGTTYNLGSQDIVYLHEQGVSDRVVTAMLASQRRAPDVAAAPTSAQPADAASAPVAAPVVAPVYAEQAAAVPETAPETAPVYAQAAPAGSTVYVISYPAATAAYYGYYRSYPYYSGPYYGAYYGPAVSFGFGYGGYCGYHGGHAHYSGHSGHHH